MIAKGFVTGLPFERRVVERAGRSAAERGVLVHSAGNDAAAAGRLAAALGARGIETVVSFGLCGGLDPALGAGDLVIAETVMREDRPPLDLAPSFARRVWRFASTGSSASTCR